MIEIIKHHLARYPKMQIRDVAKLIFQNEFGGGHMIADANMSLRRIQEEYQLLAPAIQYQTLTTESIGNGMSRIYLSALSYGLQPTVLNEMFVQSANNKKGTIENLERKLKEFLDACSSGSLPFSEEEVLSFLNDWKSKGYPAISHSSVYRDSYQPAYRVIEDSYLRVFEVIKKVTEQFSNTNTNLPYIIAIDGMSGSGKSTLADLLYKNFPESNLFHMDDYFLQPHQRTEQRLHEAGGNVDYERFKMEILDSLENKEGLTYRRYDCCSQSLVSPVHVPWKPLVIIEGSYSHHPYFENIYHLKIFCRISSQEQLERIRKRNGDKMLLRFENEWIPKETAYFEKFLIPDQAHLIL